MLKQFIRNFLAGFLLLSSSGCEKDDKDSTEIIPKMAVEDHNSPPIIKAQSFEVLENELADVLIGQIVAEDPENDKLQFTMNAVEGLVLDINSGELTTAKGAEFLDFETNSTFEFEVTISDGKATAKTRITLNIEDVDDGPLTNFEKDVIDGFKYEILSNSTDFPLYKWSTTAKIYSSGAVTPALKSITSGSMTAYNDLFTDGFSIEIVNDSLAANVQLHSSTIADLKKLWPDFGTIAEENPGLGGIAEIAGGRIWIADYAQNIITMKHEMGHMIGLNHASISQCGNKPEKNSIMCGGVGAAGADINEYDRRVIQYYYHPEITNGLDADAVITKLTELILIDREN